MYELHHIKISSAAKICGLFSGVLYFLTGIFLSLLRFIGKVFGIDFLSPQIGALAVHEYLVLNIILVFLGTAILAALGAVAGAVVAFVYNLSSSKGGGIKLDFKLVEEKRKE